MIHFRLNKKLAVKVFALVVALSVPQAGVANATASCPTIDQSTGDPTPLPTPGVNWSGCSLRGMNLFDLDLTGVNLSGADLRSYYNSSNEAVWTRLSWLDLTGANLSGADLRGVSISGSNLTNVNLNNAKLGTYSDGNRGLSGSLSSSNVQGLKINATTANGLGSDALTGTVASTKFKVIGGFLMGPGVGFYGNQEMRDNENIFPSLAGLNLSGMDLTGAGFSYRDLTNVNFKNANLTNVGMLDTYISGSNFTGAKITGMTLTDMDWSNVTCPSGAKSEIHLGGSCLKSKLSVPSISYPRSIVPKKTYTVPTKLPDGTAVSVLFKGTGCILKKSAKSYTLTTPKFATTCKLEITSRSSSKFTALNVIRLMYSGWSPTYAVEFKAGEMQAAWSGSGRLTTYGCTSQYARIPKTYLDHLNGAKSPTLRGAYLRGYLGTNNAAIDSQIEKIERYMAACMFER